MSLFSQNWPLSDDDGDEEEAAPRVPKRARALPEAAKSRGRRKADARREHRKQRDALERVRPLRHKYHQVLRPPCDHGGGRAMMHVCFMAIVFG